LLAGLVALAPVAPAAAGPVVVLLPGAGTVAVAPSPDAPPPAGHPCAAGQPAASTSGNAVRWVSFSVERPPGPPGDWHLVFDAPLVERIDLCLAGESGAEWRAGGRAVPLAERAIANHGLSYSTGLPLEPGGRLLAVARIEAEHTSLVGLGAWEEAALERRDGLVHGLFGIGFGVAVGVLLVALGLAITRPGPSSRRFVLFVVAVFILGSIFH
jgi:hypothetical protein